MNKTEIRNALVSMDRSQFVNFFVESQKQTFLRSITLLESFKAAYWIAFGVESKSDDEKEFESELGHLSIAFDLNQKDIANILKLRGK